MAVLPTFFSTFAAKLENLKISAMGYYLKNDRHFPKSSKIKTEINYGKRIKRAYQACRQLQSVV